MAGERPLVSVVIPTFNGAAFIVETLRTILAQTETDLEVIVSDGGSTDETLQFVAGIDDPRLRVERIIGQDTAADNWTRAVGFARGQYIKLVCQDDLLEATCVSRQVALLVQHPDAVMVASQRRLVDERGSVILARRGLHGLSGVVPGRVAIRRSLRTGTNQFGEPAAVLFRAASLQTAMPWSRVHGYVIDLELYSRVLMTGDLVADPNVRAAFRVSTIAWSRQLRSQQAASLRWLIDRYRKAGVLSLFDAVLGSARAMLAQYARTLIYLLLGARARFVGRR